MFVISLQCQAHFNLIFKISSLWEARILLWCLEANEVLLVTHFYSSRFRLWWPTNRSFSVHWPCSWRQQNVFYHTMKGQCQLPILDLKLEYTQNEYVLPRMTLYSGDCGVAIFTHSTHCGELSDPQEK